VVADGGGVEGGNVPALEQSVVKEWSKSGQRVVKEWSKSGQRVIKEWSIVVKEWSKSGSIRRGCLWGAEGGDVPALGYYLVVKE
jgi:hypothetical protein